MHELEPFAEQHADLRPSNCDKALSSICTQSIPRTSYAQTTTTSPLDLLTAPSSALHRTPSDRPPHATTSLQQTLAQPLEDNLNLNSLPSETAICAITVQSVPPCQCVSPPGICTTSPTRSRCGVCPLLQIRPVPIVTVKIYKPLATRPSNTS